jgi:hypothetical protein
MKISSGMTLKVGTEKKETNPVKPLDKISELDKDGIRRWNPTLWKKEETSN